MEQQRRVRQPGQYTAADDLGLPAHARQSMAALDPIGGKLAGGPPICAVQMTQPAEALQLARPSGARGSYRERRPAAEVHDGAREPETAGTDLVGEAGVVS